MNQPSGQIPSQQPAPLPPSWQEYPTQASPTPSNVQPVDAPKAPSMQTQPAYPYYPVPQHPLDPRYAPMMQGQPGYPMQPPLVHQGYAVPQKNNRRVGWIIAGSITGGILLVVVSCALLFNALMSSVNTSLRTAGLSSYTSSFPDVSGAGTVTTVGQAITVDNLSCTMVSVKALNTDQYEQPDPGKSFKVVHIKIVNNNAKTFRYDSYDFHVKMGTGNITDISFISPSTYSGTPLQNGTLAPGGSVEGDVIVQVPNGDHQVQLVWNPSPLDNTAKYAWDMGL